MTEKIISDNKNIIVVLTIGECNIFRSLCEEFLGTYSLKVSRNRALVLNKILNKIEEAGK